jgi:predicted NAD/FAD-dependent oxidoreductase
LYAKNNRVQVNKKNKGRKGRKAASRSPCTRDRFGTDYFGEGKNRVSRLVGVPKEARRAQRITAPGRFPDFKRKEH